MVRIPTYEAKQGYEAKEYPKVNIDTSAFEGLKAVGSAISGLAARIEDRNSRQQKFDASTAFDIMQEKAGQNLIETERTLKSPDGRGLTEAQYLYLKKAGDDFLNGLPTDELRAELAPKVKLFMDRSANDASNREWSLSNAHSKNTIATAGERWTADIGRNPHHYGEIKAEGLKRIQEAPDLTSAERLDLSTKWEALSATTFADALFAADPDVAGFALGLGDDEARYDFITNRVFADDGGRLVLKESSGNPNAVSPKGALGLAQVMPKTAEEVARRIGDTNFLRMSTAAREQYLKDEKVSLLYGKTYFKMMLQQFNGDIEAALIAYNGGGTRANKFLANGRDYSVLPAETRDYATTIMKNLGLLKVLDAPGGVGTGGKTAGQRLPVMYRSAPGRQPIDTSHVKPEIVDAWERTQGAFGRQLPVVSAFRDPERNAEAKGTSGSRHMHGDAFDIDVTGMPHADRVRLIEAASANGFTGIGVYENTIHLDLGNRRYWGPDRSGKSLPAWARPTIEKHMAGGFAGGATPAPTYKVASATTIPEPGTTFVAQPFRNFEPSTLSTYQVKYTNYKKSMEAAEKDAAEKEKASLQELVDADMASFLQSGKGVVEPAQASKFRERLVAAGGTEMVQKWEQGRHTAYEKWAATDSFEQMSDDAIDKRIVDLRPKGGPNAHIQQDVFDYAVKKADEIKKDRADDPGQFANTQPSVKSLLDDQGFNWRDADDVQRYLGAVENYQRATDSAHKLRDTDRGTVVSLLPKRDARAMAEKLRDLLAMSGGEYEKVTTAFLDTLKPRFGAYTRAVFLQTMGEMMDSELDKDLKAGISQNLYDWLGKQPTPSRPGTSSSLARKALLDTARQQKALGKEEDEGGGWFDRWMKAVSASRSVSGFLPMFGLGAEASSAGSTATPAVNENALSGVSNDALKKFVANPDADAQLEFREAYGTEALSEAMKLIKREAGK